MSEIKPVTKATNQITSQTLSAMGFVLSDQPWIDKNKDGQAQWSELNIDKENKRYPEKFKIFATFDGEAKKPSQVTLENVSISMADAAIWQKKFQVKEISYKYLDENNTKREIKVYLVPGITLLFTGSPNHETEAPAAWNAQYLIPGRRKHPGLAFTQEDGQAIQILEHDGQKVVATPIKETFPSLTMGTPEWNNTIQTDKAFVFTQSYWGRGISLVDPVYLEKEQQEILAVGRRYVKENKNYGTFYSGTIIKDIFEEAGTWQKQGISFDATKDFILGRIIPESIWKKTFPIVK